MKGRPVSRVQLVGLGGTLQPAAGLYPYTNGTPFFPDLLPSLTHYSLRLLEQDYI